MVSANGPKRQDRARDQRADFNNNMKDGGFESRDSFYRNTTLALSLQEVLNEFEEQGEINDQQNDLIMWQLDQQIVEQFKNLQRIRPIKITGFCTYRFREDPRTLEEKNDFFVKDMQIQATDEDFHEVSDNCLIKTIGAKNNTVEPLKEERSRPRQRRNQRNSVRRN